MTRVESAFEQIDIIGTFWSFVSVKMSFNSELSPDFERIITQSNFEIIPRSPWLASLGCKKTAGEPVEENVEAIKEYDVNQVQNGYYCSTCDPFLFLLADYLNINIEHNYDGNKMIYMQKNNSRYTIKISSDRGHCWC